MEAQEDSTSDPAVRRRIHEDTPAIVTHRGQRGGEAFLETLFGTVIFRRGNFHRQTERSGVGGTRLVWKWGGRSGLGCGGAVRVAGDDGEAPEGIRNPKSESRNPKEGRSLKSEIRKQAGA